MVALPVTIEFNQQHAVAHGQSLLKTRLKPPPQQARLLLRQRLTMALEAIVDYPLTLVVAPAGSGKTTALANFATRGGWQIAWCRMSADDDPATLLHHLVAALAMAVSIPIERIQAEIARLQAVAADAVTLQPALDMLVNELAAAMNDDTLLVLDDYHLADEQNELRLLIERLLAIQPPGLHLILVTRYDPRLGALSTVRARGEVYQVGQADLAFTVEDTQELFRLYDRDVPLDMAELTATCRGWPLVIHSLAAGQSSLLDQTDDEAGQAGHAEDGTSGEGVLPHGTVAYLPLLHRLSPLLDDYLTQQVLDDQPPDLQMFLFYTAHLRWIDAGACAAVARLSHLLPQQDTVERRCLFLELTSRGQVAYQPLFKAFLERQSVKHITDFRNFHLRVADYYRQHGDHEGVIYHLLAVDEGEQAAIEIEQVAWEWLRQGQAATLLTWMGRLPPLEQKRPRLLEALAAADHRLGQFEQAIQMYRQSEQAYQAQGEQEGRIRTLRGQAEVYLDTVQPARAMTLLKQVLKLLPQERYAERAEILRLQAENWANFGRADIALILESSANRLAQQGSIADKPVGDMHNQPTFPDPRLLTAGNATSISPRLLLRSGRLNESRQQLEATLGLDTLSLPEQRVTTFVAHREPLLLLTLIHAMLGNGARALAVARRGLLEAHQSDSQLTMAIAHMRAGHAYQVIAPFDMTAAGQHYQQALTLAQATGVDRSKAEVYLGLALLHGHNGDIGQAELSARAGIQIAESSGDEWIAALLWVAMGGAAVSVGDNHAIEWLQQARQRFMRGSDTYGQALVALWLALWYLQKGNEEQTNQEVNRLLTLTRQYQYEGLLTSLTLFGPRDMAMLVPLLLHGRNQESHAEYAQQLLRQAFPSIASDEAVEDYHPGYTLRIQMLGNFRVWRGRHEIQAREWQREKARQLFQLLLTYRGRWLQREQICAWLWPDSDLDAAERQFKVTLNALNAALEPLRPPRTAPFFIRRQGLAYSFAPSYGCWIDVDEFELRTTGVLQNDPDFIVRNSQIAVQLYRGDYLAESLYDSWTLEERERLLARFLATTTALANRLVDQGDTEHAVDMCEQVLKRDRCYEEAYQVLIRAYAQAGSRSQALRSYSRCTQALQDELGIEPLPETTRLYERIKRNEKV